MRFEVGFAQGQGQKENEDLDFFGQDEQEGQDFFSYPVNPVYPVQKTNFLNLSYTKSLRFSAALREIFFHAELSQLISRLTDV